MPEVVEQSTQIAISAPAASVWTVMQDIDRWHEWTPTILSIQRLGAPSALGTLAVGLKVKIRQPKFPPAKWEVTEVVPGSRFAWVSVAPGLRVTGVHAVEAAGAGSRVTLTLRFEGALGAFWARLTRGINQRYIELEAAGLKRRCEASAN